MRKAEIMEKFVHLHLHTEYSLLDGATRIDRLFQICKENNMPAVAITDHGNMFGAIEFFKAAARATDPNTDEIKFITSGRPFDVKPILGCEVYVADNMYDKTSMGVKPKLNHLVLLAKNEEGYRNLTKLVSLAYVDGFYYKPRIDYLLLQKYSKGLVCLSACLAGSIPQALVNNNYEKAKEFALMLKDMFGGDFYIEIQDHGINEQRYILPQLIKLAKELNIKLIATNDVHYLEKKDAEIQKILQCISFRNTLDQAANENDYFPTEEFYLKNGAEMAELFPNIPEAITNSLEIADKCNLRLKFGQALLPQYKTPEGYNADTYLRKITAEGLCRKYGNVSDYSLLSEEIKKRAEYELDTIIRLGFADYYLIVWDFIKYAEDNDIPVGPGRGSGVGSIAAYAIGITKVDPLKYDLIFERFLNSERVSNPDFDIDFCFERRDEVIQYVIEKYGADKVAQIVTFGTLASKAAVKDVGRVLGVPYGETDRITKIMGLSPMGAKLPMQLGLKKGKKGEDFTNRELKEIYENDDTAKRLLNIAMEVEGMPRNTSMHAAGVVICRDTISDHVPLQKAGDDITTQFDMIEVEQVGMLKMDFLGLRTLTDIKKTVDYIKNKYGKVIDFYNMEYDDPNVFNQISGSFTHGIFQLEGGGMKRFMHDLQPSSLEDIIAGISLYRPGPMDEIGNYVNNKRNPSKIVYDDPVLEPILRVTYGVIVYQEQVMQIVRDMAGYSFGRADIVRRMMSKKKSDEMAREQQIFLYGKEGELDGALKRGIPEEAAVKVFNKMMSFAAYAFNKSHAAAYAYIAYQTAYLMCYYPVEYITWVLNNRISNIVEVKHYLAALKEMSITINPPDINKSYGLFTVEDGSVRLGLAAIKNVGQAVINAITDERDKNGVYKDFYDFCSRQEAGVLNRKMLESLILAGAFDNLEIINGVPVNRNQFLNIYEKVLERVNKAKTRTMSNQLTFFDTGMIDKNIDTKIEYPKLDELPHELKLKMEKDVLGIYVSGHPLDKYIKQMSEFTFNSEMLENVGKESPENVQDNEEGNFYFEEEIIPQVHDKMNVVCGGILSDYKKIKTKFNVEMAAADLEDLHGSIRIMFNSRKFAEYKKILANDLLVTVKGSLSIKDEEAIIWVDNISPWEKTEEVSGDKICVYYSFSECGDGYKEKLEEILSNYKGGDDVFYKNTDDNMLYKTGLKVGISNPLINELNGFAGEGNIKVQKT